MFELPGMIMKGRDGHGVFQLSSVQNPYDIPLYWLVYKDPYIGLFQSPYNWVG